jgi:hypothetical protein
VSAKQTFADGFIAGWVSIMGPRLVIPEIPAQPLGKIGSAYIQGLMKGIEAAKKQMVEMESQNSN